MTERMIQVGVAAIRGPDGSVIKQAPLYRPLTPEDEEHIHDADDDFVRIVISRLKAARRQIYMNQNQ